MVHSILLAIGKKSGISEEDILLLPVDITNLDLHQQYFDAVISHFGTVRNFNQLKMKLLLTPNFNSIVRRLSQQRWPIPTSNLARYQYSSRSRFVRH